ncbi:MAG TPA: glycerol kinase GlpK, partial [Tepidisphaeraceae bacterium]
MDDALILAIDQGTSLSRAILVNQGGEIVSEARADVVSTFSYPGWVEQDPAAIFTGIVEIITRATANHWPAVRAIGITNQRETTIVWDRTTGFPVCPAIVWQDRRTAGHCQQLSQDEALTKLVQERTGLVIDAYFSATKLQWILGNVPGAHSRAQRGELCFGTVDSWLIWKLTGGQSHVTDFTNASRTMLFDIHRRRWDEELLGTFGIPLSMMPHVHASSEIVAHTRPEFTGGHLIPIAGVAGDQQAALFGHQRWSPGQAKNTYGTGAFLLMNVGDKPVVSKHRLLTTLTCDEAGEPVYALEGSIFIAGAAIQWLRDGLGIINSSVETEAMAGSVPDNGGVYFVPAFVGLGAPHWRSDVRGAIFGLTAGTTRAHLARAALEAMAYQTREVVEAMEQDSGISLQSLKVDGGASRNDWLMQFQADVLGVPVIRGRDTEMTALGAAHLAAKAIGLWESRRADETPADAMGFDPRDSQLAQQGWEQWKQHL